ncbi:hypothetical protein [Tardiphaga sp.]|uniref:hypothetical protein n=1 Tax=Tardiphaga sp. TaxID=1926292 RepID=UPI00352A68DE
MLTYSLGFLKVHGAAYHPIKNYRAVVLKSQNFNRERRFVGHSSNMRTKITQFKPLAYYDRGPIQPHNVFSMGEFSMETPLLGIMPRLL